MKEITDLSLENIDKFSCKLI